MKLLIVGDTHGTYQGAHGIRDAVTANDDVEVVLQVGDFGYWPQSKSWPHFRAILNKVPVPIFWADGNHEDHWALKSGTQPLERLEVGNDIWHMPRGSVLEFGGKRFLFFGGARSVDRIYRKEGVSWFPNELPSTADWERACNAENVDVFITHESPAWQDFGYPPAHESYWPELDIHVSNNHRAALSDLGNMLAPSFWFHGHHHKFRLTINDPTTCVGLGFDGGPSSMVLFDTETEVITPWR